MSATLKLALGAFVFFVVAIPAAPVHAQMPAHVRVVKESAKVARWLRPADTLLEIEAGTTLEVLDMDSGRYWVILPADVHGTRRSGWIRTDDVEAVVVPPQTPAAGDDTGAATAASHAPAPAAAPEESVTITSAPAATGAPARRVYSFEAVHFDRDRASLRPDAMERLRSIAAAFQADPTLAVNLEGHTCSLGSAAYNRSLGLRRAEAVKEYLVQQGVPPARLHASSRGEEHPEHDNARERTRRLNRRVTMTPDSAR
jgi:outer membrane protein OmpA-like peptidoglycan-associated protein